MEGYSQGTTFHIHYLDPGAADIEQKVIDLLIRFDASVSVYNPMSLLSRINRGETDSTDVYIRKCAEEARVLYRKTHGVFDPTVLPLLNYYGLGPGGRSTEGKGDLDSIRLLLGFAKVHLRKGRLEKDLKGIQLDFNALAQGYSVDLICELLELEGIHAYLVELGGEVRASGVDEDGNSWLVGIERPDENPSGRNELMHVVRLDNAGIATSGNYRKFVESGGTKIGHQLDPRVGRYSDSEVISATVIAQNALRADAWATALCVLSLRESKKLLKKEKGFEALIIYRDMHGEVQSLETRKFSGYLAE